MSPQILYPPPMYLSRLSSLPLSSILNTEQAALQSSAHTLNLSLQSLSSRSHKALIASSKQLDGLPEGLERVKKEVDILSAKEHAHAIVGAKKSVQTSSIAGLDKSIKKFTAKFSRDSPALSERQKVGLLSRNLDRLLDILELPTLLKSCITSGNYAGALDILGHVRRLGLLYPNSSTIQTVSSDCASLQKIMITNLVSGLRGGIKLPSAMKMVGWLKRVVPEMAEDEDIAKGLFLVCRLAWVEGLFEALAPLRELADDEGEARRKGERGKGTGSGPSSRSGTPGPGSERRKGRPAGGVGGIGVATGQHTERYLKRWIEIFREQSFAVISIYRSIFPSGSPEVKNALDPPSSIFNEMGQQKRECEADGDAEDDIEKGSPPSPLSTFTLHLIGLLETTLRTYLPNIQDKAARESLLIQVLYAAGSLGRLGGDFSGLIGCLSDPEVTGEIAGEEVGEKNGEELEEWIEVIKKHKVLSSRLEALAAGGGGGGGLKTPT